MTLPAGSGLAAQQAPPVMQLEGVHKFYDMGETRVHALRGVTLEIAAGEFVAVMGASGSGKSTLMNIVGCLDRPSSGRYLLNGTDVSQLDKRSLAGIRSRQLGFVFQNYNLIARTTALENVLLPTLYTRTERAQCVARATESLRLVGLSDRQHHYPSQMSGGQQQRVAIARALVNQPSILLADEPTGSLDSATSVEIMDLLRKLNDGGLTIAMVTHERDGQIQRDELNPARATAAAILPR